MARPATPKTTRTRCALIALVMFTLTNGCGSLLSDEELAHYSGAPGAGDGVAASAAPSDGDSVTHAQGEPVPAPASAGSLDARSSGDPPDDTAGPSTTVTGRAGASAPGAGGSSLAASAGNAGSNGRATPSGPTATVVAGQGGMAPTRNAPADGQNGAPVRFGSFGQMSGPLGAPFLGMVHAAKAWVADVNTRGGLNGHPVRIKFIDDGADPGRALAAARRLAEEDKVVAFYPTPAPFTLESAIGYIEQRKLPILAACNCNSAEDDSPMVFEVGPHAPLGNAWFYILAARKFAPERRKAAIFHCAEAKTCPTIADTIQASAGEAGIQIVYKAQVSLAAPDYTAEVVAARNAGADVGFLILDNPSTARLMSTARRQGWDAVFSGNHAPYEDRFLEFGDAVDGMLTSAQVVPWSTSPLLADYREAMDRYVPGGVKGSMGANTWMTGKLLEKLSAAFTPNDVTSEQILQGLHGLDRETLGGRMPPTTFPPGVGHKEVNLCVYPVKTTKTGFDTSDEYICAPHWKPVARGGG